MKCKYCNSEWQTENEVKTCPFCGKPLKEPPAFSDIEQALRFIIDTYEEKINKNPNSIIAYLGDLAPKLTKERRLIKMCADVGIITKFLSVKDEEERNQASRWAVALLNSEYFIETKRAEEAVGWVTAAVFRTGSVVRGASVSQAQPVEKQSEQVKPVTGEPTAPNPEELWKGESYSHPRQRRRRNGVIRQSQ